MLFIDGVGVLYSISFLVKLQKQYHCYINKYLQNKKNQTLDR